MSELNYYSEPKNIISMRDVRPDNKMGIATKNDAKKADNKEFDEEPEVGQERANGERIKINI